MACPTPTGRVLAVGPGKTYTVPSQAAAVAQDGDTIQIDAGDYQGDVASWNASNLTMCGMGGRARLFANGNNAAGKGIWVLNTPTGSTTTVVNVEFHDASVPDQNGAGIRFETGNLTLRNTGFYDNEDGVLGGATGTTVTIEYSEFAHNGFGDGQSHNIYISYADLVTVTASYFHHANVGHNFKSRAKENHIEDSYFLDGTDGNSSYLLDFSNGGLVYMRGNLLQKGPNAENSILVSYNAEGTHWATNTLTMVHNTVVTNYGSGTYLYVPGSTQGVTLTANLFAGNASLISGGFASASILQQSNLMTGAANVPNAANAQFWPAASYLSQIVLSTVPDPQYTSDSPQPMQLRAINAANPRNVGALQSAP
ncbi:MAG TPA: right-handed parallel beta-helix repeat-containing protein [Burkholderiaceae bacterium]|nr:right-handed parallel beta-helix repeat-containing protein [Burkholderiaceae bacterium]